MENDRAARIAVVVLLVAALMDILDQSVVLTALPTIQSSTAPDRPRRSD
ncbi:hypothetical protein AB0D46_05745 [Streptomyces sp. NPDC048383]